MKISLPDVNLKDSDGFLPAVDIFNRKPYGDRLMNLIKNSEGELVIALDAAWGEGKSTFIQMWRGMLQKEGITHFYFDAFSNDYQSDAMLALSSCIYQLIDTKDSKSQKEYKKNAVKALKVLGRAGLKVGIKAVTAGVLDDTIFDDTDTTDDVGNETSELIDKYIENQISKAAENQKSLQAFRQYLNKLSQQLGNGNKLIFVIDELDRCKPSFAISLLESVKHIFTTPNITFLLVMNRSQIEEYIKCEYGHGVDASRYLQKFISIWTSLPKTKSKYESNQKVYTQYCLSAMQFPDKTNAQNNAKEWLIELLEYYKPTLREVEKCISNFAIVHNSSNSGNLNAEYLIVSIYLSVIKVLFPETYLLVSLEKINYQDLIKETNLDGLLDKYWQESEGHPLKWTIKYSLATDEERNEIIAERKDPHQRVRSVSITNICAALDSFEVIQ